MKILIYKPYTIAHINGLKPDKQDKKGFPAERQIQRGQLFISSVPVFFKPNVYQITEIRNL